MAKIMLVEDDNNLREIYEARLAAEGYEIVSAADGEAALALGIKEKPDLIIADIMMPKVSGFDMLDIMRSTTETKNTKIIMMTALNQAEDKAKAEQLGADLYLVKSQVTLEDVVRSAKKLLGEESPLNIGGLPVQQPQDGKQQSAAQNVTSMTANAPAVPQQPAAAPPTPQPAPAQQKPSPQPAAAPAAQPPQPAAAPAEPPQPTAATAAPQQAPSAQPTPPTQTENQPSTQGTTQPSQPKPINITEATSPAPQPQPTSLPNSQTTPPNDTAQDPKAAAPSTKDEEAALEEQIEQFISSENPTITTDPNAGTKQQNPQQPQPPQPSQPAATPQQPQTPPAPQQQQQPVPTPTPSSQAPSQTTQESAPSSMAAAPRDMTNNDAQTTASPEDQPAGERVIQKSAAPGIKDGGLDPNAAASGRHKVIKPISDVLTKGPDLDALLSKGENSQPGTAPTVNSVVSPEGITSTPSQSNAGNGQSGQIMSDIIAPNPGAAPTTDPNNPPAPPVA